jgi:hypothetical protein
MALKYFTPSNHREHSRNYYKSLLKLANEQNSHKAAQLTKKVMSESVNLWQMAVEPDGEL